MVRLELTLHTEAPLVLRSRRTGAQFAPTLQHIPGTTLRGALALDYLRTGKATDPDFRVLFLSQDVSFGPLFPGTQDSRGRPLPASAVACKRFGPAHPASVGDALLRLELVDVLLEETGEATAPDPFAPLAEWEECPDCRSADSKTVPTRRDRLAGYHADGPAFLSVRCEVRMIAGVGMSRLSGTAAHGLLYSVGAIEEEQVFRGEVRLYGERAPELAGRLRGLVPEGGVLRLGAARSRGQGRVLVVGWQEVAEGGPGLSERWAALNRVVQGLWESHRVSPGEQEYFTVTLESPAVLLGPALRPTRLDTLGPADFGLPDGVERRRVMLTETVLQGWNAACGLPKADSPAIEAGAVFLFRVPGSLREEVQARLAELECRGLGERRNEGFGRVSACDPFHYRFEGGGT